MLTLTKKRSGKVKASRSETSMPLITLSQVSAVFLAIFVADVIAYVVIARSVVHDSNLSLLLRASLLCREVALVAMALALVVVFGWLVRRVPLKVKVLRKRPLRVGVKIGASAVLLGAYASSWGAFRFMGVFAGLEAARMFTNDPVQMLQHAAQLSPLALIVLPLGVIAVAFLRVVWLPRYLARRSATTRRRWMFAAASVAAVCGVAAVGGSLSAARARETAVYESTGVVYSVAESYHIACAERVGPISTWLADVVYAVSPSRARLTFDPAELRHREIVSMEEYLAGVDLSSVRKRNVIILLVESLRSDQLPAFRGRRDVLPAIQALAEDGRIFTNTYAQASHSNYADLPPLSSHYPLRSSRTHFYPKNPSYPRVLLYDVLGALGYRTAIISSQNENWGGMINYLDTGSLDHILHAENYDGPLDVPRIDGGLEEWMLGDKRAGKIDDRFTVREAMRWIRAQDGQPFFLYMNLQSSHFPYEIPSDFPRRFSQPGTNLPDLIGSGPPPKNPQIIKDLYSESLAYLDAQVGKLFELLEKEGLWDDTIVVVSADTATAFLEHGSIGNGAHLFDEVVKVPMIIRGPGVDVGKDDRLIQHIDVPPSILDLLGLPPHPAFQGQSVFSRDFDETRPVFLVSQTPMAQQYAIIEDDWKLIYDVRHNRRSLYNLANDPGERLDLARDERDRAWALAQKLLRWEALQLAYYEDEELHESFYPPASPR